MSDLRDIHYFCKPARPCSAELPVSFLLVQDFVADEPACRVFWDLIASQFRTRSKFLAVWPSVRYVAVHRNEESRADGFLLVSAPVNWQIDYVVVSPESRGRGIAAALVRETVHQAYLRNVPYVMLTSREFLRPLYESCGFTVVRTDDQLL
jgi:ribosomal protein S18 acetylase RimI-like enzyme